jgi:Haem-dependent oxidative N-demethylase, alpha subunit-like
VLHDRIRAATLDALGRLPGTRPLDPADWLITDEAHAGQMALRDHLILMRRDEVIAMDDSAREAAAELLETVLAALRDRPGYDVGETVMRPDGAAVAIDRLDPLGTVGRLVQEDFCLLEKRGHEHVLTGAVLCFPSRWVLAEKFLRPLVRIHQPVAPYDDDVARRVQRLFDGIKPGRPLWRANLVRHRDPALFQPVPETVKDRVEAEDAPYLRSERQCLVRLPDSGSVVFSIHTTLIRADRAKKLTPAPLSGRN